jgi:hypothetical protein
MADKRQFLLLLRNYGPIIPLQCGGWLSLFVY